MGGLFMDLTEKTVRREYVYRGRIITVRRDDILLPTGKPGRREVVEHCGGVCVMAVTDQDEILFVRQYRYPAERELLEIPAGKLTPGEDPAECGRRELMEETGAQAGVYRSMGFIYPSPGYSAEKIYLFYASDLTFGRECPDEDEFLEVERIPRETAKKMIASWEINDGKTVAAFYLSELLWGKEDKK